MADITEINGKKYEYELKLTQVLETGNVDSFFTYAAIRYLSITENIFEPFTDAVIAIINPYNYIDGKFPIRGDGRDTFSIYLKPIDIEEPGQFKSKTKYEYELKYEFSIVDEYNIPDEDTNLKTIKVLQLRDVNATKLNINIPYGKRYRGYAGDILKKIIEDGTENSDIINHQLFEPGNLLIDKFPQHFIPSATFRYMDALKYLLRYYYYIDHGTAVKSLLKFNRKQITPRYEFKPLTTNYFAKNKELASEAFDVGDMPGTKEGNPAYNPNNPPINEAKKYHNYINTLTNINMSSPTIEYSNSYFMNAMVTGYDGKTGVFHQRQLRIKDLKQKWQELFVDPFKSIGGAVKPWLTLNQDKIQKQFKIYSLPFHIDDNKNIVEAELINAFNFYNLQLSFTVFGASSRDSGGFIDLIERNSQIDEKDNNYEQKLLGRWFVTTVKHIFSGNLYQNELQCIKTYSGPNTIGTDNV